ncbi:MAG: fumarylacetoacetate hydrolase family protein [Alphaproteobacteria bacterium]|nr:fumarylacetoacetate hydrolase family protein [Alphaproteobacteria bacterium]
MKLASLKHGRDGKLIIVSRDLTKAASAEHIAPTLQAALDNWAAVSPKLEQLSKDLHSGKAPSFAFDPGQCASPLPRAYQWADASSYVNHVELVRKSRGADMPASFWTDPLMYQGGSDTFLGPREDIPMESEDWGIDFEAEVAIITDDVPMGTPAADAGQHIRLLMLVNDVSLRYLASPELAKGFGFFQAKPSTAFSPIAVTPDELGAAWEDCKVHLPVVTHFNGKQFGCPDAGVDMAFNFATLIAHAAKTRALCAGTIIGSGTVSNKDRSKGSSCIIERRILEKMADGESKTPFMKFGDSVKIEMLGADGQSVFGAIAQTVRPYKYQA